MQITINITDNAKELIEKAKNLPQNNENVELYLTPEEYEKLIEILEEKDITLEKYIEDFLTWCIEKPEEFKEWMGSVENV